MKSRRSAALIADDDDFFRIALGVILVAQLKISDVLETETLDQAMEIMATDEDVDFAFFDLNMQGLDTIAGIRATREAFPNIKVAVVSGSCDRHDVLRAMEAGAHGFVPKGGGAKQLASAIRIIGDGGIFIPPFLADIRNSQNDIIDPDAEESSMEVPKLDNITPRQQEVLNHLVKGHSNKEIARALSVSESAVKFHVASLCGRLGVKNRTEIAARASRMSPLSNRGAGAGRADMGIHFHPGVIRARFAGG